MANLRLLFVAICGNLFACASLQPPSFVDQVLPPAPFLEPDDDTAACPRFSGIYERTPEVVYSTDGVTWKPGTGKDYDFAILLPIQDSKPLQADGANNKMMASNDRIFVDASNAESTIWIVYFDTVSNSLKESQIFNSSEGYRCSNGHLRFMPWVLSGGGEGYTLNSQTYRSASVSGSGDFYVYEQIASNQTHHRYFRFKLIQ